MGKKPSCLPGHNPEWEDSICSDGVWHALLVQFKKCGIIHDDYPVGIVDIPPVVSKPGFNVEFDNNNDWVLKEDGIIRNSMIQMYVNKAIG